MPIQGRPFEKGNLYIHFTGGCGCPTVAAPARLSHPASCVPVFAGLLCSASGTQVLASARPQRLCRASPRPPDPRSPCLLPPYPAAPQSSFRMRSRRSRQQRSRQPLAAAPPTAPRPWRRWRRCGSARCPTLSRRSSRGASTSGARVRRWLAGVGRALARRLQAAAVLGWAGLVGQRLAGAACGAARGAQPPWHLHPSNLHPPASCPTPPRSGQARRRTILTATRRVGAAASACLARNSRRAASCWRLPLRPATRVHRWSGRAGVARYAPPARPRRASPARGAGA